MARSTVDMTTGNGLRHVFVFSIPMFLNGVLQVLYSIADRAVVGHFLGVDAFASLVNSITVIIVFDLMVQGFITGFRALLGQLFGAKNLEEFAAAGSSMVSFMLLFNFLFIAVTLAAVRPVLRLLNTPVELMGAAQTYYLSIYIIGLFFGHLSRVFEAIIMATGNSRPSFYIGLITNVLNVALDITLIIAFGWGITAVAATTAFSMAISALLNYLYLRYRVKEIDHLHFSPRYIRWDIMKRGLSLASASIIERGTASIAAFLMVGVINLYGSSVIAGFNAANSGVDYIVLLFSASLGGAFSVFASQNYGAKQYERIKTTYRRVALILLGIAAIASVTMLLFGRYIIRIFIGAEQEGAEEMIAAAMRYIFVAAPFYFAVMQQQLSLRALQGIGDVRIVRIASPLIMTVRTVFLYVFTYAVPLGEYAAWWSVPLTWTLMSVTFTVRFMGNKWEKKALLRDSAVPAG